MDTEEIKNLRNKIGCSLFDIKDAIKLFGDNIELIEDWITNKNLAINLKGDNWLGRYITDLKNQIKNKEAVITSLTKELNDKEEYINLMHIQDEDNDISILKAISVLRKCNEQLISYHKNNTEEGSIIKELSDYCIITIEELRRIL